MIGGYKLQEADGTTRLVHYTADKHNGFNAIVKKIGHAHHSGHWNGNGAEHYGDNWNNVQQWDNNDVHHHGAHSYSNLKQYNY